MTQHYSKDMSGSGLASGGASECKAKRLKAQKKQATEVAW